MLMQVIWKSGTMKWVKILFANIFENYYCISVDICWYFISILMMRNWHDFENISKSVSYNQTPTLLLSLIFGRKGRLSTGAESIRGNKHLGQEEEITYDTTHQIYTWWRHQIETFSALLAFVRGFTSQRPVTRSWCILWSAHEQTIETQVIIDSTKLIMTSL